MILAVAGLKDQEIKAKTSKLASGDWSELPSHERIAFHLARKFSRPPFEIDDSDRAALIAQFGEARALDVLWWTARCHYMTRIADAFQLPLEKENVFGK